MCLAVYTAASLANAKPMLTAFQAVRLGIAAYIVPFVFALSPALLFIGTATEIISAILFSILGILVLSVGLEGYFLRAMSMPERFLCVLGGVGLMAPYWPGRALGTAISLALFIHQWTRREERSAL